MAGRSRSLQPQIVDGALRAFSISESKKMNMLKIAGNQQQTMTSREIAELTGSSHDSVLKTVRRLVSEGVVSANDTPYRNDQNGQTYKEFLLSFRDTMVVVSGYSAELRAKIIDRWQELESAAVDPLAGLPPEQRAMVMLMCDNAAIKARQDKQDSVQSAQAAEQVTQAETLKRIESNQQAAIASVECFTALGYSIFREIPMSKIELIRLGKIASAISKKRGVTVDHVADGRHGRVGSYHISVLNEALEELMK